MGMINIKSQPMFERLTLGTKYYPLMSRMMLILPFLLGPSAPRFFDKTSVTLA